MNDSMNNAIYQEKRKIDFIPLLTFIGLYVVENFSSAFMIPLVRDSGDSSLISLVWMITKLIPLLIAIIIYRKRFASLSKDTAKGFGKFLLYCLVSFIVFYFFEIGLSYYQQLIDKLYEMGEASNQETINELFESSSKYANYIYLFITIVIAAPLLEEFEFRELIFKAFRGCHFIVPVIVSSLLFGLAHTLSYILEGDLKELLFLPVYMIPGFALSLIYHYSKNNLYASFLVHMTTNLISFIVIINQINQAVPTAEI